MPPQIDHIIILLPHAQLLDLPPWLTQAFTISPGGTHADGRTANKLIVFQDGSYIELIAFVRDEGREAHWWGTHAPGIIDWALTSSSTADAQAVNHRIESAFPTPDLAPRYAAPQHGGRTRPDGEVVKWTVTFPTHVRRGEVPFWCHDITPRALRVPISEAATTHPCGAIGISALMLSCPKARYASLTTFYAALFDGQGRADEHGTAWDAGAVYKGVGIKEPVVEVRITGDEGDTEDGQDGQAGFAVLEGITLLTDSIGLGQSRTALVESVGESGRDVIIAFEHGRTA